MVDDIHKRYESVAVSPDITENGEDDREGDEEEEEPQEILGEIGRIHVGSADASHGLSGIDVMTTFGT